MGKDNNGLRSLSWEDYGISKGRYKELQGFCLQYRQKKKEAKRLGDYALAAVKTESVVGCSGTSRPTESAALRHYIQSERAIRDCRMIEESAMWAASAGGYKRAWRAILRNVTDGVGFDNLRGAYDMPFSSADFYGVRRAFFHRLDQLQNSAEQEEYLHKNRRSTCTRTGGVLAQEQEEYLHKNETLAKS